MLIAISLLSSLSEDERFQASGTVRLRLWCLGEIGRSHPVRGWVHAQKGAESILTDF